MALFYCSTMLAQGSTNITLYQQWKTCFCRMIQIWDGAISYSLEHGIPEGQEICLTNLECQYTILGTNIIRCPSGQLYKPRFLVEDGPGCPVHPIEGVKIIGTYMLGKRTNLTYENKISFLNHGNPSGVRRFAILEINDEDAKQHPDELKKVFSDALVDEDEMLRHLVEDQIIYFAKGDFKWAKELVAGSLHWKPHRGSPQIKE